MFFNFNIIVTVLQTNILLRVFCFSKSAENCRLQSTIVNCDSVGNRLGQLVIDNDIHPQLVSPVRHSPGNENLFICSNICFYPSPSSQPTVSGWDRAKVRLGDWKAVKWHWDDTSDICKHNKTPGHWHHQPQSGETQWHHTAPIQKVSSAPQLQCSMSVPRDSVTGQWPGWQSSN